MASSLSAYKRLEKVLSAHHQLTLAVSGGVDSMTLAHIAHRVMGTPGVEICHAVSPAVPETATARVKEHSNRFGWRLHVLDAGEFSDPNYLRNPVNRCYFCKSNLYDRIAKRVEGRIASGANIDDLGDYRPGLGAASERNIIHPFVEADCGKQDIRDFARQFQLEDIAELPAQPCLASRIETGLRVIPKDLRFVEEAESALAQIAPGADLRCRVINGGIRVEFTLQPNHDPALESELSVVAHKLCERAGRQLISIEPYQRGSAFLHEQ